MLTKIFRCLSKLIILLDTQNCTKNIYKTQLCDIIVILQIITF
jgi:hypothetical protein